jgi:hypothetical protein
MKAVRLARARQLLLAGGTVKTIARALDGDERAGGPHAIRAWRLAADRTIGPCTSAIGAK